MNGKKGGKVAKKYYAVRVGKTPGIYMSWDDCKAMVDGYPGAQYKGFATIEEAERFLQGTMPNKPAIHIVDVGPEPYAFVDGSYNVATKVYGYGGFLIVAGDKHVLQGAGDEEEMASMRNVAGEILGCMAAVNKAVELGLSHITIYYDYIGIEMWATGEWKRNKASTVAYYDYIQSIKHKIKIDFVKVKGHSGIEGNEEADRLAKDAVGVE